MKLRTIIIDDEPIALEKLRSYVEKVPFLELAGKCSSGLDALEIMAKENIDLIFTDINMPDLNGLEFVGSLSNAPLVVFITAYEQYAVESYRLSAVDYLLKPFGFSEFQRAANKALERIRLSEIRLSNPLPPTSDDNEGKSLFVKVDYRYVRVDMREITHIKGYGEYLRIYVKGQESPLVTLSSFAAMRKRLSGNFLQVHRSYVVNMDSIDRIEKGRMFIGDDMEIPLGDSFKADLQRYLLDHGVGKGI